MLTQENKMNKKLIKKIMTKRRLHYHLSIIKTRKKVETEKVNKLLSNTLTGNIAELNELIYAGSKQACDKEPEQKYKTRMEN